MGSHDETSLLSCSDDKIIKIWDVANNYRFKSSLIGHSNWVRCGAFSKDGRLIVTSDDKTVKMWDVRSNECVHTFYDHTDIVNDVQFHPESTLIASTSDDKTIKVFDIRSCKLLQHYDAHKQAVKSLAFHPLGNFVISAANDKLIKVWDIIQGHQLYTIHGHESPINAITFSQNGQYFASCSDKPFVMVWKTNFDQTVANKENDKTIENQEKIVKKSKNQNNFIKKKRVIKKIKNKQQQNENVQHAVKAIENIKLNDVKHVDDNKKDQNQMDECQRPSTAPYQNKKSEEIKINASHPSTNSVIPEQISLTLEHMVNQLTIITQTLGVFEERLSMHEDRVANVEKLMTSFLQSHADK